MNFYISKIKLWFHKDKESRILNFKPNKVNIITGDSSTGKSSILKIIDYCLLDERCTIVQDIINENILWYGLVFVVDNITYTIIRKAPSVEQAEMCVILRDGEFLPDDPKPKASDIRSKVMVKMNNMFNIPSKIKLNNKIKYNFRHNLLFNYLTEDIISTENTYQDLRFFRAQEFTYILDDIFKISIGVNESKIRELKNELKSISLKLTKNTNIFNKEHENIDIYNKNQNEIIKELIHLELCDNSNIHKDPKEWSTLIEHTLQTYNIQFNNIESHKKRKELEEDIKELKSKLGYYISLKRENEQYLKRLKNQNNSLIPLDYIKKHMQEIFHYDETKILYDQLKEVWTSIKENCNPQDTLPQNFKKRMLQLENLIRSKSNELKKLNPMQIESKDLAWTRSMILLSERITKEITRKPTITIKEETIVQIKETKETIKNNLLKLEAKNDNAISKLNKSINKYFSYQDGLSESYKNCKPIYSIKEHMIMLERNGLEYPIANIGSKSNYMFLHLCYFFGLHELLIKNKNTNIPQFLFIDQPSIPYYADKNNKKHTQTDDKEKLRAAFKLIDKFMRDTTKNGNFQIIMIEHAGVDYWEGNNKLDTFETSYQFINGNGLIPNDIYKTNDKN